MTTAIQHSKDFDSIEDAIRDIAEGKMVIVTDDESRENEGDLIMAAAKVTPQAVNQWRCTHVVSFACPYLATNYAASA